MWTENELNNSEQTIIHTKASQNLWYLLAGLGSLLYGINFLSQAMWLIGLGFVAFSVWLIYKHLQEQKSKPLLILNENGIQIGNQPALSWSMAMNIYVKSEISQNQYIEKLMVTNNGRIQEIPLNKTDIKGWQLENIITHYQTKFIDKMDCIEEKQHNND
ncbi:MAG: hypothetical protein KA313_02160 [Pseudarcicella sp.]|nr:hypothetical protein [Pseudarcicella sp.]MBP6409883.1 hypothetical protein [Pseudarcicella sp.]